MVEREEDISTGSGMAIVSFFAGALLGAGLALLYSPKTGREMRERMSDLSNEAMRKMKDFGTGAQEKVKSSYYRGKEMVQEQASRYGSSSREPEETTVH